MGELQGMATALAIGLLAGLERGWAQKAALEGSRVAGIRTFGMIGLLGGVWALLSTGQPWLLALAFAALAGFLAAAYLAASRRSPDIGITTEVAALVTFSLGALAVRGNPVHAAAAAVVAVALLGLKPQLHRILARLGEDEFYATLKLLLLVVVLLPILPDRGFGPWAALNPFELGWMVVLIAGMSYVGYFATRLAGPALGTGLTSLLGGMTSSTAVALHLARADREDPSAGRLHAAGVAVAAGMMFPRMLVEAGAVHPALLPALLPPLGAMALCAFAAGAAIFLGRAGPRTAPGRLENPLQLGFAFKFGLLLAAVLLAASGLRAWLGDRGLYISAALAGLGDVDAITLTLARMAREGLDEGVAVRGVIVAAGVNTLVKALLVGALAGRDMALWVGGVLALTAVAGLLTLLLG